MTATQPFVHLHCHSHYSLLDGANRVPELVRQVKTLGMNAVALTDHGNLYGAIELYREATAAGIKPIIGYEAYVAPGRRTDRSPDSRGSSGEYSYHLTLLARNEVGFKNLIKMSSLAFLDGFYYRPRIDKELLEAHSDGLVCLSGCLSSEFSTLLLKDQLKEAKKLAEWFRRLFKDHFFIEIQNNGIEVQKEHTVKALDLAKALGIPPVATCDAHYLCQPDAVAHDVLLCINTGKQRSDTNRLRYTGDQFYVREPAEMYALFPEQADAVRRSQEIADRIDLKLDFKKRHFPVFHPPDSKTAEAYLRELCEAGLRDRYGPTPPPAAQARLDHELNVINRLGFASYFLIVSDFVRFAREKGIPSGARGSACGALVSYVLKLSHVDPLEYDLLFERFLDPNRAEAPDIDIDFCQDRRDEVIQYVRQKYGENSVAQIATFGTLAARAAIKDVGRVLGIELDRVNQISNLIPKTPIGITIEEAMDKVPDLKEAYRTDPRIKELLDLAMKIEGTNRNIGTHAAGVVIANGPITDYVPVQRVVTKGDKTDRGETNGKRAAEADAVVTTQWTMEDLEKVGMLKMDFLGLRTLTLLTHAVRLIKKTRQLDIDLERLPLDDAATFKLLQSGQTQGVFQFESEGIRNLLRQMKPDNLRDIIASTALYRPGPLQGGMVDSYINRKHGREQPTYEHPLMEEILRETYGVMNYQEQVMRILNVLGGIELSSAYACIKAISKKKTEIIDARRVDFIKGAVERGVSEAIAKDIFEKICFFGGYGFNKSHSTAYALVSYQTAYLKAHYPAEFMAAVLTSELGDTDKLVEHIKHSREIGLAVLPPDVNASEADFSVAGDKCIRFGLMGLRGVGRKAAEMIVAERCKTGPFKDLFDFCERTDPRVVTKAAIETLVKAGALDSLGNGNRAALIAAVPGAVQAAVQLHDDRRRGQRHIFELLEDDVAPTAGTAVPRALPSVPAWSRRDQTAYEKEAVGFYLSDHPLAEHEFKLKQFSSCTIAQVEFLGAGTEVQIGGMITGLRLTDAKRARGGETRMARFMFEDLTGSLACVMFPDDYSRHKAILKDEWVGFIKAEVDRSREPAGLIVTRLYDFDQAQREQTTGLILRVDARHHRDQVLDQVGSLLRRYPGRCEVYLEVCDCDGRRARLRVGRKFYIDPAKLVMADFELLLGVGNAEFLGAHGNGA